jgi:HAD superfamily hydrolase (TIGR01509 family)
VVFDADGVLVDSEPAWAAARAALFRRHGREFTEERDRETLGTGVAGTGEVLAAAIGDPARGERLNDELLALLIEQVSERPPRALPGAVELLEALRGRLPIGVASNSPRALLGSSLAAAGLEGRFDVVVGVDEVAHGKPAPDLYLAALEHLGAEPAETVAVEDSPVGVASARGAGLHVIGVQALAHVDLDTGHVVDSLAHPSLRARLGLSAPG